MAIHLENFISVRPSWGSPSRRSSTKATAPSRGCSRWIIKVIKSPVLSILGLLVVAGLAIAGKKVDFRRGSLFVEVRKDGLHLLRSQRHRTGYAGFQLLRLTRSFAS